MRRMVGFGAYPNGKRAKHEKRQRKLKLASGEFTNESANGETAPGDFPNGGFENNANPDINPSGDNQNSDDESSNGKT
jgi:hypothetical protein